MALHDGHPVYFLVFRPHPERGGDNDSRRREPRHYRAARDQWVASRILVRADWRKPDALQRWPPWGLTSALFLSDLGHGEFDGANLVSNFEMLNPGRNYFGKYYDLFADVEGNRKKFLEFERWWGGFHYMTEAEIRWIVEQLFIGSRLSRGETRIEHGRRLDFKAIRSPIIVFASWGDNITPPQQALNWIADTYADEHEIKICGQRIIYMIHEKVGHLGIFVSSSVAKKEHAEVASTMKTIEALAPGLYEMTIEEEVGEGIHKRFRVSFSERRMSDILFIDENDCSEETDFAAVARLSEFNADARRVV